MKYVPFRNYFYFIISIFALTAVICFPTPISAAGSTLITVSAPTQSISLGTQFTVNIQVQPNSPIIGAQFNLSFNPSLVNVNNIAEGNLFKQNGANTYFIPGTINNNTGVITGVACVAIGNGQSVSNPGIFAVITMTARTNTGTSTLNLSNVIIGDINGQSLGVTLVNSQVIISNGLTTTATTTTTTITPTTPTTTTTTITPTTPTTTTTTITPTTATTTTSQTVSGGGGGGSTPVASGVSVITPYVNAQGVFNQNINIWSDDQNSLVSIPSGTTGLTSSGAPLTQISMIHTNTTPAFQAGAGMVDLAYDITPNGITFNPAVTLTFSVYNLPASLDPITLQIAYYDTTQNTWITVPTTFNATNFTVSAQISHFTVYAVTYGIKVNSSLTTTTTTPVVTTTLINSSPISNTTSIPAATVTISSTTSIPVTTSENTAEDQTTLTVSTNTNLETNTEITPALETLTMTPKGTKVVRMYILAAIIGVAAFLIAITASLIWLRRRSLQKNNSHLN
jgi:trimeric autotransporter adhesin